MSNDKLKKFIKKIIEFIILVIIATVCVYLIILLFLKLEFNDSTKFSNILYKSDNICLSFDDDGYNLSDCNGGKSSLSFDSSNKCNLNYSKGFNAFVFKCKKDINIIKFSNYNFNKISFTENNKKYTLINNSVFKTKMYGNTIKMNFIDSKKVSFYEFNDISMVNNETCNYSYKNDTLTVYCNNFFRNQELKFVKYENNEATFKVDKDEIVFELSK